MWELVEARSRGGADQDAIDEQIWDEFGETWAIMFTDLTGFSRMVARFGIIHFLQIIADQRRLFVPLISQFQGKLLKEEADSLMILFPQASDALDCALAMQRASRDTNRDRAPEDQVLLCLGIGFGRMLRPSDHDVFGHEVNIASKLGEDVARAGEILMSEAARDALAQRGLTFEALDVSVAGTDKNYRLVYSLD
jgi:adenylate cyclase